MDTQLNTKIYIKRQYHIIHCTSSVINDTYGKLFRWFRNSIRKYVCVCVYRMLRRPTSAPITHLLLNFFSFAFRHSFKKRNAYLIRL